MRRSRVAYGAAVAFAVMGGASPLAGQAPAKPSAAVSTLPAAQPTAASGPAQATSAAPVAPHHIQVSYSDGQLAVEATNASLNEILHEISQKTGMKITGGVTDDRVFGQYGPSKPALVLDSLLEGTGSNFLLVDGAKGNSELILTPRHGGVTPPNPNAAAPPEESEDRAPQYVPPVRPYQPPIFNGRGPGFNPSAEAPTAQTPDGSQGDGSGPKTPQQIYDQLQRVMQQQKQAQSAPPQ